MIFPFNPDENFSKNNGIFGLPKDEKNARILIIPVPWDVTTSYRDGTAYAPEAILAASYQIDLFDTSLPDQWSKGIFYAHHEDWIMDLNSFERRKSKTIIDYLENFDDPLPERLKRAQEEVNQACLQMNSYVSAKVAKCLAFDKIPAILGGEHSVSFSAIAETARKFPGLGILHIDAHADLRKSYLDFEFSHASVMRNVMENVPEVGKLVQVAVRDLCSEEAAYIESSEKIKTYYNTAMVERMFEGETWKTMAEEIVASLPQQVYISHDIDGLKPSLCPHTGTPVPEGLTFEQAVYIFKKLVQSGRQIVGFDLVEVAPDVVNQWDETVGSRMLYQLCIHALASEK